MNQTIICPDCDGHSDRGNPLRHCPTCDDHGRVLEHAEDEATRAARVAYEQAASRWALDGFFGERTPELRQSYREARDAYFALGREDTT